MRRRLIGEHNDSPISPFVDTVANGMGAMFLIVMILYLAITPVHPVELKEEELPECVLDTPFIFTFPVAGGDKREFSIDGELPDGLAFDQSTGTLSGTVGAALRKRYPFSVTVHNPVGYHTVQYDLDVVRPPQIQIPVKLEPIELPVCTPGIYYAFTFPTKGDDPKRFELSEFPAGLQFDQSTGTLFGVAEFPAGASKEQCDEDRRLVVAVQNDFSADTSEYYLPLRPSIFRFGKKETELEFLHKGPIFPPGRVGVNYESVIGISGGLGVAKWKSLATPEGLSVVEGRLQGKPIAKGTSTVSFEASFESGSTFLGGHEYRWEGDRIVGEASLTILDHLHPLENLPPARVAEFYASQVFDSPLRANETVTCDGLPEETGLHLTRAGTIEGMPTQTIDTMLIFTVSEGSQKIVTSKSRLLVMPARPRESACDVLFIGRVGEAMKVNVPYRGLIEPVSITASALPMDLSLDQEEVAIVGVPLTSEVRTVDYVLEDQRGVKCKGNVTLKIVPDWLTMGGE